MSAFSSFFVASEYPTHIWSSILRRALPDYQIVISGSCHDRIKTLSLISSCDRKESPFRKLTPYLGFSSCCHSFSRNILYRCLSIITKHWDSSSSELHVIYFDPCLQISLSAVQPCLSWSTVIWLHSEPPSSTCNSLHLIPLFRNCLQRATTLPPSSTLWRCFLFLLIMSSIFPMKNDHVHNPPTSILWTTKHYDCDWPTYCSSLGFSHVMPFNSWCRRWWANLVGYSWPACWMTVCYPADDHTLVNL